MILGIRVHAVAGGSARAVEAAGAGGAGGGGGDGEGEGKGAVSTTGRAGLSRTTAATSIPKRRFVLWLVGGVSAVV